MHRIIRQLALFSFLSFLITFTHCTKSNSTEAAKVRPVRIGFVLATLNEERYTKDRNYFLEYAKKQGADVEFAACDDKVDVQTAKVETLLAKGIDVLVIQPVNGEAASAIVSLAKKENVPVIAYDRIIRNAEINLYVTQDSFKVGVLQAEEAVRKTKNKGNYLLLMGEAGHSVADEISRGVMSVLGKFPGVKVVVKQNHPGWSTALALSTVENALTRYKNNIQAILANNDGMALGAVQALDEQKLSGKVFVAGADADLTAVRNILQNKQSLTILKGIRPLAEAAVSAAIALARNTAISTDGKMYNGKVEVSVINTPVTRVVKENIDETIIQSGFHTRDAVYGKLSR